MQYLPLLAPDRIQGMVIVAGCPAAPIELPDALIADWVSRAGNREQLREIALMFSINPDPALLEEWADDAIKASRYALEASLRALLTPFAEQIAEQAPTIRSSFWPAPRTNCLVLPCRVGSPPPTRAASSSSLTAHMNS